jgi:hypothetical protein
MHVNISLCVKHALAVLEHKTILPVCLNLCGVLTGIAASARQSQVQGN